MKQIRLFSLLFCAALLFTACVGEEEDLFDQSAAERLQQTQKQYTNLLKGTTWAMEYYPIVSNEAPKGLGYLMPVRFNTDGTVTIALKHQRFGNRYYEDTSLWEVITDQGMVLSFNSYNDVLHTFSDPGVLSPGQGYEGDYEFVMVDVPEDGQSIMLKGKKRGTYVRMTRLPDDTNFEEYLIDVNDFQNRCFSPSYLSYVLMNMADYSYYVMSMNSGIPATYPVDGDPITETTYHPYLITKKDGKYYLRFRESFVASDGVQQQMFVFDEESGVFRGTDNGDYIITGEDAAQYFLRKMTERGQSWTLTSASEMSEKMKMQISALTSQYSSKNFTYTNVSFVYEESENLFRCRLVYRATTQPRNRTDIFNFTMKQDDATHLTMSYVDPSNTSAETNYVQFSALQDILKLFTQQFVVTAADGNRFNLTKVRLTSVSDPDIWFVL